MKVTVVVEAALEGAALVEAVLEGAALEGE